MSTVYHYFAFGLRIRSDFVLAELVEIEPGHVDVLIQRRTVARPPMQRPQLRLEEFGPSEQYLGFLGIGRYLIHGIDRIDVDLDPDFNEGLIGFSLLGPVMAVLLHLRGIFTLHGSSAELANGAAIFLGDKGAGKSTMIGAIASAQHAILTDDVVAIAGLEDARPALLPAFPMIKLTDAAIAAFNMEDFDLIPTDVPNFGKRRVRLRGPFPTEPSRPRAAYVLVRGEMPAIEPLTSVQAYQALLRYSYATRFGSKLIHGQSAATHMKQCASLTSHISVARLVVPNDLAKLADVVSLVEAAQPRSGASQ